MIPLITEDPAAAFRLYDRAAEIAYMEACALTDIPESNGYASSLEEHYDNFAWKAEDLLVELED